MLKKIEHSKKNSEPKKPTSTKCTEHSRYHLGIMNMELDTINRFFQLFVTNCQQFVFKGFVLLLQACTETRQPINYGFLTVSSMKFNGMCPEWVLKCFSAPF